MESKVRSTESKVPVLEGGENGKSTFAVLTTGVALLGEGRDRNGVGGGKPLGSNFLEELRGKKRDEGDGERKGDLVAGLTS